MIAKPAQPVRQPGHPLNRGMKAAWLMTEGQGDPVDRVRGYEAQLTELTEWTHGPYGHQVSFEASDGVSRGVVITEDDRFSPQDGNFTAAVVFRVRDNGLSNATVFVYYEAGASTNLLYLRHNRPSEVLEFFCRDDGGDEASATSTTTVPYGEYHAAVLRRHGSTVELWIDGTRDTTATNASLDTFSMSERLALGAWEGTGNHAPLEGDISYFAFDHFAWSDSEIRRWSQDPWWDTRAFRPIIPMLAGGAVDEVRPVCVSVDGRERLGVGVDGQPRLSGEVAGKTRLNVTVKGIICR